MQRRISSLGAKKTIERAASTREGLSKIYNVAPSRIVWIGDEHFIIVKEDGETIRI